MTVKVRNSVTRLASPLVPRLGLLVQQPPQAAVEAGARRIDAHELPTLDLAVEDARRRKVSTGVVRRGEPVVVPLVDAFDGAQERRARQIALHLLRHCLE